MDSGGVGARVPEVIPERRLWQPIWQEMTVAWDGEVVAEIEK